MFKWHLTTILNLCHKPFNFFGIKIKIIAKNWHNYAGINIRYKHNVSAPAWFAGHKERGVSKLCILKEIGGKRQ
jgi:hypothetical protein